MICHTNIAAVVVAAAVDFPAQDQNRMVWLCILPFSFGQSLRKFFISPSCGVACLPMFIRLFLLLLPLTRIRYPMDTYDCCGSDLMFNFLYILKILPVWMDVASGGGDGGTSLMTNLCTPLILGGSACRYHWEYSILVFLLLVGRLNKKENRLVKTSIQFQLVLWGDHIGKIRNMPGPYIQVKLLLPLVKRHS